MNATLEDRTYSILESQHYPEQKFIDNITPGSTHSRSSYQIIIYNRYCN